MTRTVDVEISPETVRVAPMLRVFGLVAANLPQRIDQTALLEIQQAASASLRSASIDGEKISEAEPFASWRETFRGMGLQPSKYRSSVEALVRRALKGPMPVTGVTAVDLYNAASVRFLTPMGGYDLDKLTGRIEIRPLREGDVFDPLGGEGSAFPLKTGILVYAEEKRIVCYGLNHRDSKLTCIDDTTVDAVFFAESVDKASATTARASLRWLSNELENLGALCGTVFEATSPIASGEGQWDETV